MTSPFKNFSSLLKLLRWLIAVLLAVLTLLLVFRDYCIKADQSIYYSTVSSRIGNAIEDVEVQNKDLVRTIQSNGVAFTDLNKFKTATPFYIYENSNLVYWSESGNVPAYSSVMGAYAWAYISNSTGKYLVHKDTFDLGERKFEAVSIIELERLYPVQNSFINSHTNTFFFNNIPIRLFVANKASGEAITINEKYLCSYECELSDQDYLYGSLATFSYILLVVLVWCYFIIEVNQAKHSSPKIIIARIVFFLSLRVLLLILNLPEYFSSHEIFSSEYYAASFFSESIFDLVLNIFCAIYFLFELISMIQHKSVYRFIYLNNNKRNVFIKISFSIVLSWIMIVVYYLMLKSIVINSTISLNLIEDLDLSIIRFLLIFSVVSISFIFFYLIHLTLHLVWRLQQRYRAGKPVQLLIIYGICILISSAIEIELIFVSSILFGFSILSLVQGYPSVLGKMKYQSFIYIFLFSLISSLIIGSAIYFNGRNKVTQQMTRYGERLLYDRDEITEFLLQEASVNIQEDVFIREKILSPFSDLGIVKEKIQKKYLSNYFNDYAIRLELFDATGEPFNMQPGQVTYNDYYNTVLIKSTYLNKLDLYSYNDQISNTRRYISVNKIKSNNSIIAYIIVELESGKYNKNSVFPELVLDQKQVQDNNKDYDYCIFNKSKLETNYGYFNYDQRFINFIKAKQQKNIYECRYEGYFHVLVKGKDGAWIVVSRPYSIMDILISNASIYFLFHIAGILIIVLLHVYRISAQKRQVSYAAKVQIYLNLAFFIPLLLVSIITLGFVNKNYEQSLVNRFINDSDKLAAIISSRTIFQDRISKASATELLLESDLTRVEQLDINVYSTKGVLISTNQPEVYRKGILSNYIDPTAIASLLESRNQYTITNQQVGDLSYRSIYRLIRVPGTGGIAGIVHLPFFESKEDISKQISTYLKTILNIFSIGFIILLLISYVVAYYLTFPLKLITQGIKKTGLYDNEPILWESSDEIGRLVQEYNSMLVKLDDSKLILANSEKESAWREMARQVAHEIKNPLTPMKLKLQYLLQRIESNATKPSDEELKQSFRTILTQIDSLSEIASSFSSFYKLPELTLEKVEVNNIVKDLAALHQQQENTLIQTNVPVTSTFILADQTMIVNILNNLLLNAIQSIPDKRNMQIQINVSQKLDRVLIEVKDNGSGIPPELREKIFVPYFSTKYSGSGIGLALAKRLVEDMKGVIWFETSLDVGTSFYIEMPYYNE